MLKVAKIVSAGAVVVFGLLMGGSAVAAEVEQNFKFYCAQCHGEGGKGDGPNVTPTMPVTPRNFANKEEMNKLTDADIVSVIMEGGPALSKSPIMPPWSQTLTKEEAEAMVAHLRKLCDCKGKQ